MSRVNGPLRACLGPNDPEGEGRERYWDLRPDQRATALPELSRDAMDRHAPGGSHPIAWDEHAFARGFMDEWRRDQEN